MRYSSDIGHSDRYFLTISNNPIYFLLKKGFFSQTYIWYSFNIYILVQKVAGLFKQFIVPQQTLNSKPISYLSKYVSETTSNIEILKLLGFYWMIHVAPSFVLTVNMTQTDKKWYYSQRWIHKNFHSVWNTLFLHYLSYRTLKISNITQFLIICRQQRILPVAKVHINFMIAYK